MRRQRGVRKADQQVRTDRNHRTLQAREGCRSGAQAGLQTAAFFTWDSAVLEVQHCLNPAICKIGDLDQQIKGSNLIEHAFIGLLQGKRFKTQCCALQLVAAAVLCRGWC